MTEDEMVGWHHRLNLHGFGWTLGVGHGQGVLACCGSWGCKEYNQSDFAVGHLVMSVCRVFSCVVGRGCLL